MRILVVEDEAVVARRLVRLLRELLGERAVEIACASTLDEGRALVARRPPDLVLLDLDLHGEDGFRLLAEVSAERFQTVVVSARHGRALEAFEHGVVDFVPKPYGIDRLRRALERVGEREEALRERLRWLGVRKGSRVVLVPVAEVVLVEGAGDYSRVVCRSGEEHLHAKTLADLETLLPPRFLRIHRSAIVDLAEVETLEAEEGSRSFLRLRDGRRIRVGRSYREDVRRRIG